MLLARLLNLTMGIFYYRYRLVNLCPRKRSDMKHTPATVALVYHVRKIPGMRHGTFWQRSMHPQACFVAAWHVARNLTALVRTASTTFQVLRRAGLYAWTAIASVVLEATATRVIVKDIPTYRGAFCPSFFDLLPRFGKSEGQTNCVPICSQKASFYFGLSF